MKIFITGASGFVGNALSNVLLSQGHSITAVDISPHHILQGEKNFNYLQADTTRKGSWQESLADCGAVVNLAGINIFKLWTKKYKDRIYTSRILTTRNLVKAIPENSILCSTSAAGYYGNRGDTPLTEDAPPGNDFLATVCVDWEKEALKAEKKGARVSLMRFGVVLGKNGGALSKMLLPFRFGMGGPLGNGQQWFPWIHMADLIAAIQFVLNHNDISGPINFTAPQPLRQKAFAKALGQALHRPALMPAPALFIKLIMGELAAALMCSQKAVPDKLVKNNFNYTYPDIEKALSNIVKHIS